MPSLYSKPSISFFAFVALHCLPCPSVPSTSFSALQCRRQNYELCELVSVNKVVFLRGLQLHFYCKHFYCKVNQAVDTYNHLNKLKSIKISPQICISANLLPALGIPGPGKWITNCQKMAPISEIVSLSNRFIMEERPQWHQWQMNLFVHNVA